MIVYGLVPTKYKNATLFAGSIFFYSMGVLKRPIYIVLFLLTILFNFIIGEFIENFRKAGKLWLVIGIIFNFWWLAFFKYTGFTFNNINIFLRNDLPVRDIILPIGISFYTFQNVSYIVDVYRRKAKAETNLINYGAYISMFPQLIAGPIVKYETVAAQLRNRTHSIKRVEDGLKTFTIGLGYKVLLANQVGGLWKKIGDIGYQSISTKLAWLGIIAFTFQIYFDFCGYSYMAIGLGRIMGFDIPQNFNHPYMSTTMGEFWRRWHMTLGNWFKEYVYIPLGGNRVKTSLVVRNFFVVWLFTGVWHGASWNFVIWGMVLFGLIMLERFVIGDFLNKYKIVGHLYMFLVIPLTWLLFAITDFRELGIYFSRLVPIFPVKTYAVNSGDFAKFFRIYWKYFVAGTIFSTNIPEKIYKKIKDSYFIVILLLIVFWASVYCMYQGKDDPFLYYTF